MRKFFAWLLVLSLVVAMMPCAAASTTDTGVYSETINVGNDVVNGVFQGTAARIDAESGEDGEIEITHNNYRVKISVPAEYIITKLELTVYVYSSAAGTCIEASTGTVSGDISTDDSSTVTVDAVNLPIVYLSAEGPDATGHYVAFIEKVTVYYKAAETKTEIIGTTTGSETDDATFQGTFTTIYSERSDNSGFEMDGAVHEFSEAEAEAIISVKTGFLITKLVLVVGWTYTYSGTIVSDYGTVSGSADHKYSYITISDVNATRVKLFAESGKYFSIRTVIVCGREFNEQSETLETVDPNLEPFATSANVTFSGNIASVSADCVVRSPYRGIELDMDNNYEAVIFVPSGYTITKVELTVNGNWTGCGKVAATCGVVSGSPYTGGVVLISNVNAGSVRISNTSDDTEYEPGNYYDCVEIGKVTVYYEEKPRHALNWISSLGEIGGAVFSFLGKQAASAPEDSTVSLETIPLDGYTVSVSATYGNDGTALDITDGTFTMPDGDVTASVLYQGTLHGISSLGETGGVTFTVGTETVSCAKAGTTVTAASVFAEGYLATLSGTYGSENKSLTIASDGTFTMPAAPVTVTATYRPAYTLSGSSSMGSRGGVTYTFGGKTVSTATEGSVITAAAKPINGYVTTLSGTYGANNTPLEIASDGTFTMPAEPVRITATYAVEYLDADGTTKTCDTFTVLTGSTKKWTSGWYVVDSNVNITNYGSTDYLGYTYCSGAVHLILVDGCTLTVKYSSLANGMPGIHVGTGNSLTIYGQSLGTGTISAEGARGAAGIGGGNWDTPDSVRKSGSITINGGTILATGYGYGAGIGGGMWAESGEITIHGGTVTAKVVDDYGKTNGAGIGGGYGKGCGNITITGGTVNATGATNSAGIGGGGNKKDNGSVTDCGNIKITGGTVTATGGTNAPGIGGGYDTQKYAGVNSLTVSDNLAIYGGASDTSSHVSNSNLKSTLNSANYHCIKIVPGVCKGDSLTYPTIMEAVNDGKSTIKLLTDVKEKITIASGKSCTLDLNGCVLKGAGGCVIDNSGNLTVKDSNQSAAHYFQYRTNGVWNWITNPTAEQTEAADLVENIDEETTVVKVLGGCITGGSDSSYTCGGGIRLNGSAQLTMNGGNVVGNWNYYRGGGIGLYGNNSKAFLYGGSVIGNHTDCYSGSGNYSTGYCGGGLDLLKDGCSVTLGGTFRMTNNTSGKYTIKADNLRIGSGRTVSVDGFSGIVGVACSDTPTEGNPVVFSGKNETDYSSFFLSDSGTYVVNYNADGCLELTVDTIVCFLDDRGYTAVADAIQAATAKKATLKLLKDVTGCIAIPSGKNIVLDLNGHTVTAYSETAVVGLHSVTNDGTMEITDSNIVNWGKFVNGGIRNDGTMTIVKGTIDGSTFKNGPCIDNNGTLTIDTFVFINGSGEVGAYSGIDNSGTLTVIGGVISDFSTRFSGGGIYNSGTLNISGGIICNNSAYNSGGGIYNSGTLTISGGNIVENSVASGTGSTGSGTLSGIGSGSIIDIGGESSLDEESPPAGGGIYNTGTLTISGGSIQENTATEGGGIYNSGTLTISGGDITENSVDSDTGSTGSGTLPGIGSGSIIDIGGESSLDEESPPAGGGIYNTGTLTTTGGSIQKNTAAEGGGIYNSGRLSLFGGTISNNKVESSGSTQGIPLSIEETDNARGGGVYNSAASSITLGGNVTITGNTTENHSIIVVSDSESSSSQTADNLYLPCGKVIKLGTGTHSPASNMNVGVTAESTDDPVVITDGYADTLDYSASFTLDDSDKILRNLPLSGGQHALAFSDFWFDTISIDGNFVLAKALQKTALILTARYDSDGRLVSVAFTPLSTGTISGTATLPDGTGGTLRFFLMDASGYKPLTAAMSPTESE